MFDVDDVVADLQIAEVGEEGGDFGFLALRARGDQVGFVEEIAGSEDGEVRFGKDEAVGDVGLEERGGENFSGEVGGFVGIAFAAAGAAAQAIAGVVFGEDVGEALDFSGVGGGEDYAGAGFGQLLYLLGHGGHGAVEARGGLGEEGGFDLGRRPGRPALLGSRGPSTPQKVRFANFLLRSG